MFKSPLRLIFLNFLICSSRSQSSEHGRSSDPTHKEGEDTSKEYSKREEPRISILYNKWPKRMVKFIDQKEATKIDEALFNEYKYSVDQLMELAGLSCATAIYDAYPNATKALVYCGPGNNGGDGLVCARHLKFFGIEPEIFYPKRTGKPLYENLMHQCASAGIHFLTANPTVEDVDQKYDIVVDALFGFSYRPPVREEFVELIETLNVTKKPVCSIDIPSGWHVESGPHTVSFQPELLISLTAPKQCAIYFTGKHHYLGGRFIPKELEEKYDLRLPPFPGSSPIVKLG